MGVRLDDEARRYVAALAETTGVTARDCIVDEERAVFVLAPAEMGRAIGPDGERVRDLEERLGRRVELIEDADTPGDFVANALAPAAVLDVSIEGDDEPVARVEVAEADVGVAVGEDGRNVEMARRLAKRHFDVADVELR